MIQSKKLKNYCKSKLLDFDIDEDKYLVLRDGEVESEYLIVDDEQLLFDEDLEFLPITKDSVDGFVYEFCGRWYLQDSDNKEVQLRELINIGKAVQKLPTKSFLGIHSGYELMNGVGLYKEWINKAKFLGIEALGICEYSTLSGVLVFQNTCKDAEIKPIIGLSIPVIGLEKFNLKLYVRNFQGWLNLLKFNSLLNVDKEKAIKLDYLKENIEGLFLIADPKTTEFSELENLNIDFYQLDTVNFLNEETDTWYINNLEKYLLSDLKPISICDAYYLEKEDYKTREVLWTIGKSFDEKTNNQFFKNRDQYAEELIRMFDESDKTWITLYKEAIKNEAELVEQCNFSYDTDTRHLPKYIMSEEESSQFNSNEDLFIHLVKEGFKAKDIKDSQKYIERLRIEIDVLRKGDVIDYFLSLHDIIRYAKSQEMLTGIGRGSAGGSLVAYLLGIIQIDPLEFDLLFERFLNSGRMGSYEDRPSFKFTLEDSSVVELAEGSLIRVLRDSKEKVIFVHEVQEEDDLIKY